jgi:hypothetical protein
MEVFMSLKSYIILFLFIYTASIDVNAKDEFTVIAQEKSEFSVNLKSFDECTPHTIEKYTRNYLYGTQYSPKMLIKQHFEIGKGCFEGYHPQTISVSSHAIDQKLGTVTQDPIWRFDSKGIRGEAEKYPYTNLYIVQESGCCDASHINKYYSLKNGNLLAFSSKDLLIIGLAQTNERRFVGIEENLSASKSYEGEYMAVIFYSDDTDIKQKLVVKKPGGKEGWILDRMGASEENLNKYPITVLNKKEFSNFNLYIRLICRCEADPINIFIPVVEDTLDIKSATVENSIDIKIIEVDHYIGLN